MTKKPANFPGLWERLKVEAELSGNERLIAVLMNNEGRKEYICRKLGVVSDMDVNRMASELKSKSGATTRQNDRLPKRTH